MGINSILSSIFSGYREAKKDAIHDKKYGWVEHSPFLHSSQYLTELYKEAKNTDQEDAVLENILYHWDVVKENPNYRKLHDHIIDKRRG